MTPFLEIFLTAGLVLFFLVTALWVISLIMKDAGIVDIFWGTGFVIMNGIYYFLTPDGFELRKLLLNVLVTLWGLRLSLHILIRNWGQPEDYRYANWRREAGNAWWWRSYFKVFLLQGVILWIVSMPLLAGQISENPAQLTILDFMGILIWAIGFFFEAVGDWQLSRFKANPANKGKLLTSGVWRFTRHPNYFGDAAQWWGFYLIALAGGGYWTIFSPLLMTWLIIKVSGVAMLERALKESKPAYEEYIDSTNAFIPWMPRKRGY